MSVERRIDRPIRFRNFLRRLKSKEEDKEIFKMIKEAVKEGEKDDKQV